MKRASFSSFVLSVLLALDPVSGFASNPPPSPILQLPVSQLQGGTSFTPVQLPHWRAAVAVVKACAAGSAYTGVTCSSYLNPRVLFAGDSTIFGGSSAGGLTTPNITDWLATFLTASGIPSNDNSFCGSSAAGLGSRLTYDTRFTNSGWIQDTSILTLGGFAFEATASGNTLTYKPNASTNAFRIFYSTFPGIGSYTATVTGGSPVTINGNAAQSMTSILATTTTPSASNTLTLVNSASSTVFMECVEAYNNTVNNVDIINAGYWGSESTSLTPSGSPWGPIPAVSVIAPVLTIVEQGINDWDGSVPVATTIANIQAFIAAAQAAGSDVLLVTGTPNATNTALQAQQIAAMNQLAQTDKIPIVDINSRWVSYAASSPLGMYIDTIHPNSVGYADQARAIANVLANP